MNELVEFYFANVHHWIPILHVKRFRQQIQTPEGWDSAIHVLHAIVATCIRLVNYVDAGSYETRTQIAAASRQRVILNSMESFSVENLQALVIIAFDTVRGRKTKRHLRYKFLPSNRSVVDVVHRHGPL